MKLKFMVRYFNGITKKTERHNLETTTVGQALMIATAMVKGKDVHDLVIVQED